MHMLLPFFRNNRLSFATLLQLYHSVLALTVIYGLKVATLTKRNRQSLYNMEPYIIFKLKQVARDPPQTANLLQILRGRTIDRPCY